MKKNIFILVFALFCCTSGFAQRLSIKESPDQIAYNGEGKYAIIVILANDAYKLSFTTSQDGPDGSLIESVGQKEIGNQIEYTLTFEAKSGRASGSTLFIDCPGYNRLDLQIELSPNQAIKYMIEDPEDPETKECAEKHWLIGERFFRASNYERAKSAYSESLNCWTFASKVDKEKLEQRITDVDKILSYQKEAKDINLSYKRLCEIYAAIYDLNSLDNNAEKSLIENREAYEKQCFSLISIAETLLREKKEVEKTTSVLNKYIDVGCGDIDWASAKLEEVRRWKKNFSRHTLTYEYAKGASLGISSGNYNVDNSSGYFTLRVNPNIFEAIRLDDADTLKSEVNVSIGFTIPLYSYDINNSSNIGLWLFFGPGLTMLADIGQKYTTTYNMDGDSKEVEVEDRFQKYFAASPEVGFLLKIPLPGPHHQLALRYTFQYRYAFEKEYVDLIGKTSNVIGVGFTF